MTRPDAVDFHFDIMCPYAYMTSRWIQEVRDAAGVEVRWRFFSLEEVNRVEGKRHPWEHEWSYGWSMMRIGAYLRRQDMELLDRWYETAGRALHVEGRKPHRPEVAEELLVEMGLDPGICPRRRRGPGPPVTRSWPSTGPSWPGGGLGVHPALRRRAGPVRTGPGRPAHRAPGGSACGSHVTGWLDYPHLYELQRPKTPGGHRHHRRGLQALPRGPRLVQRRAEGALTAPP